jgi:hypothetical protein
MGGGAGRGVEGILVNWPMGWGGVCVVVRGSCSSGQRLRFGRKFAATVGWSMAEAAVTRAELRAALCGL